MDLTKPFEINRLKFRLLNNKDVTFICRQFSDPDMCLYFNEPPCDMDEAKEIIAHYQTIDNGYLRYGLFNKYNDDFIGTCGYHYYDPKLKQVEIGYDIWKDYWRQGYLSEALPKLIQICFDYLDVDCIYILVHPKNKASKAGALKFGFKPCEPCRQPDANPQDCLKLMRSQWISS